MGDIKWINSGSVAFLCTLALAAPFTACGDSGALDASPGVPLRLAEDRADRISDLEYELTLRIPASVDEPIDGLMLAAFNLSDAGRPLALDFDVAALIDNALRVNPTLSVLQVSPKTGAGMDRWLEWIGAARQLAAATA